MHLDRSFKLTMRRLVLLLVVGSYLSACSGARHIAHSHTIPWSLEEDLNYHPQEKWVTLYRKLENSLLNSPELLDVLRETFFPSRSEYQAKVPASIDGIQVHLIPMCVTFSNMTTGLGGAMNHNSSISKCLLFRWTNSRLLNLIPADQLGVLDPFWTKMLYSAIVTSWLSWINKYTVISLELSMDEIGAYNETLNEDNLVISMAILLSWSKNMALDKTGEHWSKENQGYVVPWFDYYTTDNRYQEKPMTNKYITVCLNILFVSVNAFVLLLLARYSTKISATMSQLCVTPNFTSSVHKGTLCTATLLVITYIIFVLLYDCLSGDFQQDTGNSSIHEKIKARIVSLCVRVGIFIFAGIAHAAIAVYSVLITHQWKIFKYRFLDIIVLWGTFMFCQQWFGVFSIPIVMFLTISPTLTLFHLCSAVLIYVYLTAPIAYVIHYFNRNSIGLKCSYTTLSYIIYYLVTLVVTVSSSLIYFEVMTRGAVPHGVLGFFLSFIPPIILSLIIWMIKTKLFTNKKVPYKTLHDMNSDC